MATIQDLAKWGYETSGKSTDFRNTELWAALDPLINSPFVPKEWKESVTKLAEEGQKKVKEKIESLVTPFENRYGVSDSEESILDRDAEEPVIYDPLSEDLTEVTFAGVTEDDFKDNTRINYEVFFQE